MSDDYYKTLGLKRNAKPDEVQKAYRNLARKYHPDLNPNDNKAKAKFQDVQKAYEVLNDPEKRKLYDRYGSSFEAFQGHAGAGPTGPRGGAGPRAAGGASFNFEDLNDLFGGGGGSARSGRGGFTDFFRQFTEDPAGARGARPSRGADVEHELEIPFATAVKGGEAQIRVAQHDANPQAIQVKIPAGVETGQRIRVRGQAPARPDGQRGDILIRVKVAPHPTFQRTGRDLVIKVPVSIAEAVLGGKIDVPTPQGTITLSIPPGTSSGKRLRVKGHGVRPAKGDPGDLYAEVQIVVPETVEPELAEAVRRLDPRSAAQLRGALQW